MNNVLGLFLGVFMFISMILFMFVIVHIRRMFGVIIKKIDIVINRKNKSSDSQKSNK